MKIKELYVGQWVLRVRDDFTLWTWELGGNDDGWVEFEAHSYGLVRVKADAITVVIPWPEQETPPIEVAS